MPAKLCGSLEYREAHRLTATEVLQQLDVDADRGLSTSEALSRLAKHGRNELVERGGRSAWQILCDQLTRTMVIVLMIAAMISLALHDYKDDIAILAVVVLNAAFGFVQEYRAEQAIAALKNLRCLM